MLCIHYPRSSLFLSPFISSLLSLTPPTPFPSGNYYAIRVAFNEMYEATKVLICTTVDSLKTITFFANLVLQTDSDDYIIQPVEEYEEPK